MYFIYSIEAGTHTACSLYWKPAVDGQELQAYFSNLFSLKWNSIKVSFFECDAQKEGSVSNFIICS